MVAFDFFEERVATCGPLVMWLMYDSLISDANTNCQIYSDDVVGKRFTVKIQALSI